MSSIFFAVLVGLAIAVYIFMQFKRAALAAGIFCATVVIGVVAACWSVVGPSRIGVVTTFGAIQDQTLPEGLHLVNPMSQVHSVFVGLGVAQASQVQAASKDLQTVHTDLTVNYRISPDHARQVYALDPSLRYQALYIQPAMYEVFKAVSSRYTAEELVTKRMQFHPTSRTRWNPSYPAMASWSRTSTSRTLPSPRPSTKPSRPR
jgi:regulator of protease activity HflC (stomatin/prohibitin superfamily)